MSRWAVASWWPRRTSCWSVPSGDAVVAFSATCTHQGCQVDSVHNGQIGCPCHGSAFDATTGAVLAGPARRPLSKVAVVVKDDSVYTA